MNTVKRIAATAIVVLLSACSTAEYRPSPVDVTRFHLGSAVVPGRFAAVPANAFAGASPEDALWTGAVSGELARLGYSPVAEADAEYLALVDYVHRSAGTAEKRPPLTIGIGGGVGSGGYRGGVGVGGGAQFGVGGGQVGIIATDLTVKLKRVSDGTVVWEGHATAQTAQGTAAGQSAALAPRLAAALFKGFPGESGITITVK